MKRWKDLSTLEQTQIVQEAQQHGIYPTVKAYRVKNIKIYPDTLKYQINNDYRETVNQSRSKLYHAKEKFSNEIKSRNKKYREKRAAAGITREKWLMWWQGLSENDKKKYIHRIKEHRFANLDHYKTLSKKNYEAYVATTTPEERKAKRLKQYTRERKDTYNKQSRYMYKTDQLFKLKCIVRSHINRAITRDTPKKYTSTNYLGCTIPEFRKYIEQLFKEGMSWDNHGRGPGMWHLDHILPLAAVKNIHDDDTLKLVCNFKNYQPLWENENLKKSTRIEYPFIYTDDELYRDYATILKKPGSYTSTVKSHKNILHFQPHYYNTELNILNNDQKTRHNIIINRQKYLNKKFITTEEMVYGLKISGTHYGYSHFPYQVIKKFITDFSPQCIYDPCGGWGHRLLAAGDLKYIYNDIWSQSFHGVNEIIKFHNIKNKITYNNDCTMFTPTESYDTVFTCPPYYNKEIYNDVKFADESEYYNFLDKMLMKSIKPAVKHIGIVIDYTYKDVIIDILTRNNFSTSVVDLVKSAHHFTRATTQNSSEVIVLGQKKAGSLVCDPAS
jgi:hypothetical protein